MEQNYSRIDSFRNRRRSYSSTWDEDDLKNEKLENVDIKTEPPDGPWAQTYRTWRNRAVSMLKNIPPFFRNDFFPLTKRIRFQKTQIYAFLLLLSFGVAPFAALYGLYGQLRSNPFGIKTLGCEGWVTENSTVSGFQGLFVIDFTFGSMPFSLAKFIDIVWDLCIGRGAQMIAWFFSYVVFTNALLRSIERHPAPYRTFTLLALEGATLSSMGALLADLSRYRSKRSVLLFSFMGISILYILSMPTILSAMTGYVGSSVAYVSLKDSSQQIVSADDFFIGTVIWDGEKIGLGNGTCIDDAPLRNYEELSRERYKSCNCSAPDGRKMTIYMFERTYLGSEQNQCTFDYPNNTQKFFYYEDNNYYNCNMTFNVTIDQKTYNVSTLNTTYTYCYNGTGYDDSWIRDNSRCMPNTDHPTYQWGFSTMLSAVFVILQFSWAISMYIVWQDAQWNSSLVKSGYSMTQLRAAFTLAAAAQDTLAMDMEELMAVKLKTLEKDLSMQRVEINYKMFQKELPSGGAAMHEEI